MDTVELLPHLHMFRFRVGQAYLWSDHGSLTLIDAGPPGSGGAIARAVRELGHDPAGIRNVVVTHGHEDHFGAAAKARSWGARVLVHRLDAPIVRGRAPRREPVLLDWERPLYEEAARGMGGAPFPASPVDQELEDGDLLDFGGGARVLGVPGHTDGSVAVHLPEHGVLFTGDTVASHEGRPMLGVFNTDRSSAAESLRRLAGLDARLLCFGHGDPVADGASAALRETADQLAKTP